MIKLLNPSIEHLSLTKTKAWLRAAALVGGLLAFVMATAPSTHAQRYSDWSSPVNLGPVVNSTFEELSYSISKNGLSLYFSSDRPGGPGGNDMWVSQRASVDDPWGAPVNLGPTVNTSSQEGGPVLSGDEHFLFFQSNRPGGLGGTDIWVSWRQNTNDDFAWQPPVNLGAAVNSPADERTTRYFENLAGGAPQLYFSSFRLGTADIFRSEQMPDGSFGPAMPVTELNSSMLENGPEIRRDGLEMFFSSDRTGSLGADLWVATRESTLDPWFTPVNLGATLNTTSAERSPHLSADSKTLFFSSDRPGGSGTYDIYMSTRTRIQPAVVPGQSLVLLGGSVSLGLTNTLNFPSTYQWQFNGTGMANATNATLALNSLTLDQSGIYSVTVSNEYEVVASTPATVQVVDRVTISDQPLSRTVPASSNVTLSVTALSPLPITYQWQRNSTNLPGATNASLTFTNAQFDPHTGYYRVLVGDTVSNVLSDIATLIVLVRPTVTSQPVAQTVLQGGTAIFTVVADPNHPLLPLSYRWERQGVNFLSNAPPTLIITNVQPGTAGSLRVTITNLAGSVLSASVNLTVLPDFDRDGMADAWEKLHGFETNSVADALLDFDGDGMVNRDEYAAGTNPTNAASVLKMQLASQAGGQSTLTFLAISNRTYSVEWNTEASGGTWNRLQDVLAQPADRIESVTDTDTGGPMRFYRVVTPRRP